VTDFEAITGRNRIANAYFGLKVEESTIGLSTRTFSASVPFSAGPTKNKY